MTKSNGELSQSLFLGTPRNKSISVRSQLPHREMGKVKKQSLAVSTHWDTEKKTQSIGELSQCLLLGTPRKTQSLMANSCSHRSVEHREISKVKN